MSDQPYVPQLRPLGIGEILDVAIKITTRHWWTLARAVLVVVVPIQLLAALVDLSAAEGVITTGPDQTVDVDEDELWGFVAAAVAAVVLTLLAQTIATGACFKAVTDAYLGREPSWRRSLAVVLRNLHSIVWISILTYTLGFLALLALIVPGIWLFISWTVAIPAFLTEGVKGRRALGRSFRLVRGFWWRTFAVILIGSLLAGIVQSVVSGALTALVFTSESEAVDVLANLLASIASGLITTPFVAAVTIVLYVDLRVRKEGFDLALLAARFGDAPPAGGAPFLPPPPPPGPAAPLPPTGGSTPPYWPPPPGWKPDREET